MPDNHTVTEGSGSTFRSQDNAGIKIPYVAIATNTGSPFSATNPVPVTSNGYIGTATVTRPANTTPYTANNVIGGPLTLANIGPSGGHIIITSIDIILNITALPAGIGNFILILYDVTPASAFTNGTQWSLGAGDRAA
jgi:hypothetical protein